MTNRVDRLTARRLVERHPATSDRRGVIVRLTPSGMHTVDAALEDLLEQERGLLAVLPDSQRSSLAGQLRRLLAPFES